MEHFAKVAKDVYEQMKRGNEDVAVSLIAFVIMDALHDRKLQQFAKEIVNEELQ